MSEHTHVKIAVIGAGPGGYTAAFRAADLLKERHSVALIEKDPVLGGVCLNVGCIPSKSLLDLAHHARHLSVLQEAGLDCQTSGKWDLKKLTAYQQKTIKTLNQGLDSLCSIRQIIRLQGTAEFVDNHTLSIQTPQGIKTLSFDKAIIAVGSRPISLPFLPNDPRVVDSTGALALKKIPKKMLIIGGGIIGMEMASVYHALGSQVDIAEMAPQCLSFIDDDLVAPLLAFTKSIGQEIFTNTKVTTVTPDTKALHVHFEDQQKKSFERSYDLILQCVGRRPNTDLIALDKAGITPCSRGFIPVNAQLQTSQTHIFAIGDCAGDPMLAHKASAQAKIAAQIACGSKDRFEPLCIPSVAYTDPEIAWVGATEKELKAAGQPYKKAVFPWAANGRALAVHASEGLTKLLFDPQTHLLLGAGVTGRHAGDLIGELALALEMQCVAQDLSLTIHPHPTFAETIAQAAEVFEGSVTDLPPTRS